MSKQRKTKPFHTHDTKRSLPMALLRSREAVMAHFRPLLKEHGITEQQWRVLRVLGEAEQTDLGALATRSAILAPSLSRILTELERRKLVTRKRDPGDARVWLASLMPDGEQLIAAARPDSEAIYAQIEEHIGAKNLEHLLDLLLGLTDALPEPSAESCASKKVAPISA